MSSGACFASTAFSSASRCFSRFIAFSSGTEALPISGSEKASSFGEGVFGSTTISLTIARSAVSSAVTLVLDLRLFAFVLSRLRNSMSSLMIDEF